MQGTHQAIFRSMNLCFIAAAYGLSGSKLAQVHAGCDYSCCIIFQVLFLGF